MKTTFPTPRTPLVAHIKQPLMEATDEEEECEESGFVFYHTNPGD